MTDSTEAILVSSLVMLLSHKHRTYSLRHPLALEVHHRLAARSQLLGQAQEPCAARGSKGRRVQVVLDPLESLFELCRRFRELRGDELLVEQAPDVGDR